MKVFFIIIIAGFSALTFSKSDTDRVVVSIGSGSCLLNEGDDISTTIKDNKYAANFERNSNRLTIRIGDVSRGSFSTILYMDNIPVPTSSLSFQAGNLMAFGSENWASVGVYNLTNSSEDIIDFYKNVPDCENGFASK